MKTSNDNENRFTKDVLLRQIFQEISDENSQGTPMNDLMPSPEKSSSQKNSFLKWIFIVIFLTGVIYLWFYTVTEVTQENEVQIAIESSTDPKTEQIEQEKEVIKLPDVVEEKPKKHIVIEVTDPNQPIEGPSLKTEGPRTERERAKEALMLQMQN